MCLHLGGKGGYIFHVIRETVVQIDIDNGGILYEGNGKGQSRRIICRVRTADWLRSCAHGNQPPRLGSLFTVVMPRLRSSDEKVGVLRTRNPFQNHYY